MALSMDNVSFFKMSKPPGATPDGLKVTTLDSAAGTATVWGQDDQKVSLSLDQMYKLILTA